MSGKKSILPKTDPNSNQTGSAAVAMRLAGASYEDIAETLGFADAVEARNSVERNLARRDGGVEARNRLRVEEAARIERLMRSVWGKAIDPSHPEHLVAVRQALSLVDRHARLLGLDAPAEVIVHSPAATEIDAWVARVLALKGSQPLPEEVNVIDGEFEEETSLPALTG